MLMILAPGTLRRREIMKIGVIFWYFFALSPLINTFIGESLKPKTFCTDAQNSLHSLLTCFCPNPSLLTFLLLQFKLQSCFWTFLTGDCVLSALSKDWLASFLRVTTSWLPQVETHLLFWFCRTSPLQQSATATSWQDGKIEARKQERWFGR